jgi:hypothetical protein
VPGWYAWRFGPGESIYPYMARVYNENGAIRADMHNGSWGHDIEIDELARREWFGPLPETDCASEIDVADCCTTLEEARGVIRRMTARIEDLEDEINVLRHEV